MAARAQSLSRENAVNQPPAHLNQPLGGNAMPRFAGLASMMRLPVTTSAHGLDGAFIGVPLDIGTSNRSGTRFGPRQIRA